MPCQGQSGSRERTVDAGSGKERIKSMSQTQEATLRHQRQPSTAFLNLLNQFRLVQSLGSIPWPHDILPPLAIAAISAKLPVGRLYGSYPETAFEDVIEANRRCTRTINAGAFGVLPDPPKTARLAAGRLRRSYAENLLLLTNCKQIRIIGGGGGS
jgi:hypothetical protein